MDTRVRQSNDLTGINLLSFRFSFKTAALQNQYGKARADKFAR